MSGGGGGGGTDYLLQIVALDLGFSVPDIQSALKKTNYAGASQAIDFLMNNVSSSSLKTQSRSLKSTQNQNKNISATDVIQLKNRIKKLELSGSFTLAVSNAMIENALQQNDSTDAALNYIMDKHQSLIKPNINKNGKNKTTTTKSRQQMTFQSKSNSKKKKKRTKANSKTTTNTNPENKAGAGSGERIFDAFEKVSISGAQDANAYKQMLKQQASDRKAEQEREELARLSQLAAHERSLVIEEKSREVKRVKHEARLRQNRQKHTHNRVAQKKARRQNLLEWHLRHEEYDRADQARQQALDDNRSHAEQLIDSPQNAIEIMFDRCGRETTRAALAMLMKILAKVMAEPGNDKYRRINLNNRKVQTLIVTPLGAIAFLKFLGFERHTEVDAVDSHLVHSYLVLSAAKLNVASVQNAHRMLEEYAQTSDTFVVQLVADIQAAQQQSNNNNEESDSKSQTQTPSKNENNNNNQKNVNGITNEELYCGIMSLHEIIRNICISPMSEHLRILDINGHVFKQRIGRFPKLVRVLKKLGFKLEQRENGSKVFVFRFDASMKVAVTSASHPQIAVFRDVLRDLAAEGAKVLRVTPLGVGLAKLRRANSNDRLNHLAKLLRLLLKAVEHILDEPLEMKFQSISLSKLKGKFPELVGIVSLLKLFGFKNSHKNEPSQAVSPKRALIGVDGIVVCTKKGIHKVYEYDMKDLNLLKWRKVMLEQLSA